MFPKGKFSSHVYLSNLEDLKKTMTIPVKKAIICFRILYKNLFIDLRFLKVN